MYTVREQYNGEQLSYIVQFTRKAELLKTVDKSMILTYLNNSYPTSQVYVARLPVSKVSLDNDTLAFIGTAG